MECKKENVLNIILKDNEIENFKKIIDKCKDEEGKVIGFKNKKFTESENKLLKDIHKAIN